MTVLDAVRSGQHIFRRVHRPRVQPPKASSGRWPPRPRPRLDAGTCHPPRLRSTFVPRSVSLLPAPLLDGCMTIETLVRQPSFADSCPVTDAVRALASASAEGRGAIFTRREVVEFMLDLVGYDARAPLHEMRALEPSFGNGDFLIPMIERLLVGWQAASGSVAQLARAVRGGLSFTAPRSRRHGTAWLPVLPRPGLALRTSRRSSVNGWSKGTIFCSTSTAASMSWSETRPISGRK